MKIKTSELTGAALDWAVAKCVHESLRHRYGSPCFNPQTKRVYETEGLQQIGVYFAPSTDWAQAGPIIEREGIGNFKEEGRWVAHTYGAVIEHYGPTPLIAAMRCYVALKLGDDVEIPEELCK
jgi:hypothetical protein